jgi:hypothetical protein
VDLVHQEITAPGAVRGSKSYLVMREVRLKAKTSEIAKTSFAES